MIIANEWPTRLTNGTRSSWFATHVKRVSLEDLPLFMINRSLLLNLPRTVALWAHAETTGHSEEDPGELAMVQSRLLDHGTNLSESAEEVSIEKSKSTLTYELHII